MNEDNLNIMSVWTAFGGELSTIKRWWDKKLANVIAPFYYGWTFFTIGDTFLAYDYHVSRAKEGLGAWGDTKWKFEDYGFQDRYSVYSCGVLLQQTEYGSFQNMLKGFFFLTSANDMRFIKAEIPYVDIRYNYNDYYAVYYDRLSATNGQSIVHSYFSRTDGKLLGGVWCITDIYADAPTTTKITPPSDSGCCFCVNYVGGRYIRLDQKLNDKKMLIVTESADGLNWTRLGTIDFSELFLIDDDWFGWNVNVFSVHDKLFAVAQFGGGMEKEDADENLYVFNDNMTSIEKVLYLPSELSMTWDTAEQGKYELYYPVLDGTLLHQELQWIEKLGCYMIFCVDKVYYSKDGREWKVQEQPYGPIIFKGTVIDEDNGSVNFFEGKGQVWSWIYVPGDGFYMQTDALMPSDRTDTLYPGYETVILYAPYP